MPLPPPPGSKQPVPAPSSLPPRPPQAPGGYSTSSFKPAYSSAPSYSSPSTTSNYNASNRAPATGNNAFTAFQPRSVASSQPPYRTHSPIVSGPTPPPTTYAAPPAVNYPSHYQSSQQSYQAGPTYYGQQSHAGGNGVYGQSPVPQIANPFPQPGQEHHAGGSSSRGRHQGGWHDSGLDPDTEAQIAQWQSAYMSRENDPATGQANAAGAGGFNNKTAGAGRRDGANAAATGANMTSLPNYHASTSAGNSASATPTPMPVPGDAADGARAAGGAPNKTVVRSGGGQTWTDPTLLEWDPAHFRLFVGNLAGEVTDDSLKKAFSRYASIQKARVIRDKRTEKSKGYGFVSFSDGDDYFKAAREMQGKYIGSHPVLLRRATTEVRPVQGGAGGKGGKKGSGGGGGGGGQGGGHGGKTKGDGVKKHGKTKGGLKILG